jgi:hypothetical protein
MEISITSNFPQLQRKIDALGKQMAFATAVALTRTGQDVRDEERREMGRVFDRPTRYTLNSLYLQPATKAKLEARVWVKDSERPTHYILPEIYGGPRTQKRFEELLRQSGILTDTERTVPGAGARIDANGNMERSQLTQILSQLRTFNTSGFDANATSSRRSRGKRRDARYFYARQGETRLGGGAWSGGLKSQHLRTGIYVALLGGQVVLPVLLFVKGARYRKRLDFFGVAKRVIAKKFESNFAREYAKALATARWGLAGSPP